MKKLLSLIFAFTLITSNLFAGTLEMDWMEYSSDGNAQAAYVSNDAYGNTGGTITTYGLYTIHTFTSSGTFTPVKAGNVTVLVVAGGGGGGSFYGAGGGAGGLVYNAAYAVTATGLTVTIGGGGAGAAVGSPGADGNNGQNSVFDTMTAIGGGGGGHQQVVGKNGGSGGGGGDNGSGYAGGSTTQGDSGGGTGFGTAGGTSTTTSGGGGGAGGAGGSPNGGIGKDYSAIFGTGVGVSGWFAGGGGAWNTGTASSGGGAYGANGTANTGGGGGAWNGTTTGNGGSGIVIIRCLTSDFISSLQSYSEATIKTQGSYSLKGVAAITDSLNKTLTKTLSPTSNLSGVKNLKFNISAGRTGSNIKIGIYEGANMRAEITPNIVTADTFQTINWDLSAVSDANKDAIDKIIVTIVNADAANTFYLDYFEIAQAIDVFGMVE